MESFPPLDAVQHTLNMLWVYLGVASVIALGCLLVAVVNAKRLFGTGKVGEDDSVRKHRLQILVGAIVATCAAGIIAGAVWLEQDATREMVSNVRTTPRAGIVALRVTVLPAGRQWYPEWSPNRTPVDGEREIDGFLGHLNGGRFAPIGAQKLRRVAVVMIVRKGMEPLYVAVFQPAEDKAQWFFGLSNATGEVVYCGVVRNDRGGVWLRSLSWHGKAEPEVFQAIGRDAGPADRRNSRRRD